MTDVKTGKLLSDVKQEVKSEEVAAAGASPKVEVKTEVDVPAEGVHETLVQLEDGVRRKIELNPLNCSFVIRS